MMGLHPTSVKENYQEELEHIGQQVCRPGVLRGGRNRY